MSPMLQNGDREVAILDNESKNMRIYSHFNRILTIEERD